MSSDNRAPAVFEERMVGDVKWVLVRARGAVWSWLTPDEAAKMGAEWVKRYGPKSD